ncbi:Formyltransferase [Hortaea werneckii]|nr:Formyltransferase [Hortaea werneckii]
MFLWRSCRAVTTARTSPVLRSPGWTRFNSTAVTKHHDPLRILFCGADEFSIYSLIALYELQQRRSDQVASIDVLCRPDKRTGRGLKQISEVPIKGIASELELELHQIDTFKDWQPPKPFDLIVAVSFGLLVPARLINGAQYGGLNLHPSLLPDLRGPAPIQHTLLRQRASTGITLQTMHPTRFDHGMILDQEEAPVPPQSTPEDLVDMLGPLGARMLAKGVESGIFVPPLTDFANSGSPTIEPSHAPKITPEDRHIDWKSWTAEMVQTRDRVLGRLWDSTTFASCMDDSPTATAKRINYIGPWTIFPAAPPRDIVPQPGLPVLLPGQKATSFGIWSADAQLMVPQGVTIDGEPKAGAGQKLAHALRKRRGA